MHVCTEVLGLLQACQDGGLNVPTRQQNLPAYPLPFSHKVLIAAVAESPPSTGCSLEDSNSQTS